MPVSGPTTAKNKKSSFFCNIFLENERKKILHSAAYAKFASNETLSKEMTVCRQHGCSLFATVNAKRQLRQVSR